MSGHQYPEVLGKDPILDYDGGGKCSILPHAFLGARRNAAAYP